jgi:hypothetical protein
MSICVGDIIELESNSAINKLAKVIEVKKGKVEAIDLSIGGRVIIPVDCLYDKQDLTGNRLKPSEEKELALLGAKNLWVRLNPEQYKKYNAEKLQTEFLIAREKKLDEIQEKFLLDLFNNSKKETPEKETEEINIFDLKEKEITPKMPLSKFIRDRQKPRLG